MVVGAVVDDLSQVLAGLRAQDLSDLPVDELAGEVVELRRLVDGLEMEWTRRLAHLEQSDVLAREGHTSMTAFLKDRCRMSGTRAQRAVTLSHRLPVLPFVSKALETDDLSFDQMQVFTHVPDHLFDELASAEVMLVNAASPLTVADTRRLVDYWKAAVDGPGCETTAEELEERRYLHASRTFQGMVKVDGLFDPVTGDLILTALDAAHGTTGRRRPEERPPKASRRLGRNGSQLLGLRSGTRDGETPRRRVDRFGRFGWAWGRHPRNDQRPRPHPRTGPPLCL